MNRNNRTLSLAMLLLASQVSEANMNLMQGTIQSTAIGKERSFDISGLIQLESGADYTKINIYAEGFPANERFMSHVHNLPCQLGGGSHYKHDVSVEGAERSNELWLSIAADESGSAQDEDIKPFAVRSDAQSVVIHDEDGTRIACGDLQQDISQSVIKSGELSPFDATDTVSGQAHMLTSPLKTLVRVSASGLEGETNYPAHVHDLPCDINNGGSHYKIDPSVEGAVQENELWPALSSNEEGNAFGESIAFHQARGDAQSLVVHRPDGSRLACANLNNKTDVSKKASGRGDFIMTEAALSKGLTIQGEAMSLREVGADNTGATTFAVNLSGLAANTEYMAHVHNKSCATGGGAHYKIDAGNAETLAANEFWFMLDGAGTSAVYSSAHNDSHLARPEAQSVVLHEPGSGTRLACADIHPNAQIKTLEHTTNPSMPPTMTCNSEAIDFNQVSFDSYAVSDADGTVEILDEGCTVKLEGNTWKFSDVAYTITANTVLTFEFKSTSQSEIHGLGVETDNPDNARGERAFNLFGTQNDFGLFDFQYTGSDEFESFSIPLGEFFEGDQVFLTLIMDDDAMLGGNSFFKNVIFQEL